MATGRAAGCAAAEAGISAGCTPGVADDRRRISPAGCGRLRLARPDVVVAVAAARLLRIRKLRRDIFFKDMRHLLGCNQTFRPKFASEMPSTAWKRVISALSPCGCCCG